MRTLFFVALLCLLISPLASAQTGTPTSYVLKVYAQGQTAPTSTLSVTTAQMQCNQPVTGAPGANPRYWHIDDPSTPGRECLYDDGSRFTALPDGAYEGTIAAVNAAGSSAETARVPFTRARPNPPAVPTGLRITP